MSWRKLMKRALLAIAELASVLLTAILQCLLLSRTSCGP